MQAGRLRVEIDPGLGAAIADFSITGPNRWAYPIMRRAAGTEEAPGAMACFIMAPWTNRIAGAAFRFRGREHRLRPSSGDGTAIHGDVRGRPWTILDRTPISARLEFDSRRAPADQPVNYPFPFTCGARYELHADRLVVQVSVANAGHQAMPAGCGMHPYLMRRLWNDLDGAEVRCRCTGRYPAKNQLPVGPAALDALSRRLSAGGALPDEPIDAVFAGWDGRAEIHWPASGVRLRTDCSANLGHVVVYAPRAPAADGRDGPLPWFAVEPVSQVNDGFNLHEQGQSGTGTVVLDPGQSLETRCEFIVEAS